MLQSIRLIIYDLDGVLIESNPAIRESLLYALDKVGLDYDIDVIMKRMGTPLNLIFRELFIEKDQSRIPELLEVYRGYYSESGWKKITVKRHVFETLRYFSLYSFLQGIATNSSRILMEPILCRLGFMDYVDVILGVEDVVRPKPDPMMINRLMERKECTRVETVFVDDSSTGLMAGKEAGVHTVGLATGVHTTKQILSVDPDFILTDIDQLQTIIQVE